uniref:PGG domain-containing protein n=1 Tax=Acrobeloides nanus TaxID=290746 RepID=A0A914C2K8_9BILA
MFTAMCINGFFMAVTTCLTVCYLFSVPDAFYRYNFPLLEKLYTALAVTMYGIGVALVIIHIIANFYLVWLIELGTISVTFLFYLLDFLPRWRTSEPQ